MTDTSLIQAATVDSHTVVLEVRRLQSDTDPRIPLFHLALADANYTASEVFGSREALQAYLKGLQLGLRQAGYLASLAYHIPDQWQEPSGVRWTMRRGQITDMKELRSDGTVVEI